MLQDTVTNKFYYLEWPVFEVLSRWHLQNPQHIIQAVNQSTTLTLTEHTIAQLLQFLYHNYLLQLSRPEDTARLIKTAKSKNTFSLTWLIHHYLFFRIPLIRPTAFLNAAAPIFNAVFHPAFWWALFALALFAVHGIARQWDTFIHTFAAYTNWQGVITLGIAIVFAKIIHELGHAFTAHHYGCKVPTMGIAFSPAALTLHRHQRLLEAGQKTTTPKNCRSWHPSRRRISRNRCR